MCRLTGGKATIVTGVGQHQMWTAQFYTFERPRQLLTSGGLGTMGFGLPSAIGAKIARPDDTVVLIDGDGSFQMNIQELGTVYCENVPIKMIIMNNQHLGMVAQWEDRFYHSRRGNTVLSSDKTDRPYPNFRRLRRATPSPAGMSGSGGAGAGDPGDAGERGALPARRARRVPGARAADDPGGRHHKDIMTA